MSASTDPKPYHHIRENEGAVLSFHHPGPDCDQSCNAQEHIFHVGTWNCITCTGVYFALNDGHCFVAHINPHVIVENPLAGSQSQVERFLTDAEGQELKDRLTKQLEATSIPAGWDASDVRKHSLVMVCPKLKEIRTVGGTVRKSCGLYVLQTLREFLNYPEAKVEEKAGGFIVAHPDGEPHFIQYEQERPPAEMTGYRQVDEFEEGTVKKWSFQFKH